MSDNMREELPGEVSPFQRKIEKLIKVFNYIGTSLIVLMMGLTIIHAIGRYFFSAPLPGLMELSSFMLVGIIFFSGAYTEMKKSHTVITMVQDHLPKKVNVYINIFMYVLYVAFTLVAAYQTVIRGFTVKETGNISSILEIPHYPFLFMTALGWLIIGIAASLHLISYINIAAGRKEA